MEPKNTTLPTKKKFKRQKSEGKVLLTAFWDEQGLFHMGFLEQGATVNTKHYCDTLRHLKEAIQRKQPGLLRHGPLLLHNNTQPHTANITRHLLQKQFGWEHLQHTPYSPDLAPSDYHQFGPLQKHQDSKHKEVKTEAHT
jgi:histone-lysine N-methyltransferase SETMAR